MAAQKQAMEAEKLRMQQQQMAMQQQQVQQQQPQQEDEREGGNCAPPSVNPEYTSGGYPNLQKEEKEEKQPEVEPVMGQDAANEVFAWLSKLKMERYYKTFIDNGYDQLTAIGDIEKEDLKEMGVALGHIRILKVPSSTNWSFSQVLT